MPTNEKNEMPNGMLQRSNAGGSPGQRDAPASVVTTSGVYLQKHSTARLKPTPSASTSRGRAVRASHRPTPQPTTQYASSTSSSRGCLAP
jgi:hypothetical protein